MSTGSMLGRGAVPAPKHPGDELIDAARVLARNRRGARLGSTCAPPEPLTAREQEVLCAVGRGLSPAEIAASLAVSETSVQARLWRIINRLGLSDWASAIVCAFDDAATPVQNSFPADTVPRLRLSVLGPLRAWRGQERIDLGPVRQQALLAALVLRPDVTVSRRGLLDAVWGLEHPAAEVVPVYVYRIRKCLRRDDDPWDAVIGRERGGYRFASRGVQVDSTRLTEITAEARVARDGGDLGTAVGLYTGALELFRGEPLTGLPGPFAEGERRRLNERRMTLVFQKLDWQLRLGRHGEVIDELSALTSAHPHSEPLATLSMRALFDSGRQSDALAVFVRLRNRLVDDLGVEPGETASRMHGVVLRGDERVRRDRTRDG
ncbi:DNA-binding transcriptional activator of the SARP family [Amycolatopsis marina]|uniref:DNA-binding transcriptional activator of the SARP family n=1 Tax=Amycolatopsis marina TaxID=490629 RepID=A0A1I1AQV9_9PSEU|nr:BTAD domain-containing putative transcriptional regulator [Amycolatopsis marina]SFB40307.1 DNA-binding transcriptional activator of the SARP family [Amycolatopsis marina]